MTVRTQHTASKLLLILLLLGALLAGCAGDAPETTAPVTEPPIVTEPTAITDPPPSETEETVPPTEPTEPPLQIYILPEVPETVISGPSDMLIGIYDEGSYTWNDAGGNQCTFTYRIPDLAPISYSAIEVQQEINQRFQQLHDEQVTNIKELYSPFVLSLTYDSYCAEGVLSIVLTEECDWDKTNYYVYNLELETGRLLNDTQLLQKLEISEDAFLSAARASAELSYTEHNGPVDNSYDSSYSQEQLDMTLSIENIAAAQLFVNAEGKLMAAMDIYSVAGANSYQRLIEITP